MSMTDLQKVELFDKIQERLDDLGQDYDEFYEQFAGQENDIEQALNKLIIQMPADEMAAFAEDTGIFNSASWREIVETFEADLHHILFFGEELDLDLGHMTREMAM